jgi:hypothetical protein
VQLVESYEKMCIEVHVVKEDMTRCDRFVVDICESKQGVTHKSVLFAGKGGCTETSPGCGTP